MRIGNNFSLSVLILLKCFLILHAFAIYLLCGWYAFHWKISCSWKIANICSLRLLWSFMHGWEPYFSLAVFDNPNSKEDNTLILITTVNNFSSLFTANCKEIFVVAQFKEILIGFVWWSSTTTSQSYSPFVLTERKEHKIHTIIRIVATGINKNMNIKVICKTKWFYLFLKSSGILNPYQR